MLYLCGATWNKGWPIFCQKHKYLSFAYHLFTRLLGEASVHNRHKSSGVKAGHISWRVDLCSVRAAPLSKQQSATATSAVDNTFLKAYLHGCCVPFWIVKLHKSTQKHSLITHTLRMWIPPSAGGLVVFKKEKKNNPCSLTVTLDPIIHS